MGNSRSKVVQSKSITTSFISNHDVKDVTFINCRIFDLSGLRKLITATFTSCTFYCSLKALNQSQKLQFLSIYNCRLDDNIIDFSNNPYLRGLYIRCPIFNLNISNLPNLEILNIVDTIIASWRIDGCPNLKDLEFSNPAQRLDVSSYRKLEKLCIHKDTILDADYSLYKIKNIIIYYRGRYYHDTNIEFYHYKKRMRKANPRILGSKILNLWFIFFDYKKDKRELNRVSYLRR